MTKKQFEELNLDERKELLAKLDCWLGKYTQPVINKVMARFEEITSNEFAMKLIDELYAREQKETKDRLFNFGMLISYFEEHSKFDMHNHCLTHSNSYRDVLYDMYIRD